MGLLPRRLGGEMGMANFVNRCRSVRRYVRRWILLGLETSCVIAVMGCATSPPRHPVLVCFLAPYAGNVVTVCMDERDLRDQLSGSEEAPYQAPDVPDRTL